MIEILSTYVLGYLIDFVYWFRMDIMIAFFIVISAMALGVALWVSFKR